MKGRRPEPTENLKRRDTFRKNPNRRRSDEPIPPTERPRAPRGLGVHGAAAFKRLCKELEGMDLLSRADTEALVLYAHTYQDYREAKKKVDQHGHVLISKKANGDLKAVRNPYSMIKERTAKMMIQLLTEFGLTPAARARVHVRPKQVVNPIKELLKKRQGKN